MADRPILFSAPMIKALLAGTKSQTRRILTPSTALVDGVSNKKLWSKLEFLRAWVDHGPSPAGNPGPYLKVPTKDGETTHRVYPRVAKGDLLWCRETFGLEHDIALETKQRSMICYRATDAGFYREYQLWKPSIFMRRWMSRITLEVTGVRVERLQDISEADAIAEGLEPHESPIGHHARLWGWPGATMRYRDPRRAYLEGWDTINEERAPASSNPWVFVYDFRRSTQSN